MVTKIAINKIRVNSDCKAKLQLALKKSAATIQRYLDEKSIMLTTKAALEVIVAETGLMESEILETVNA